MTEKVLNEGVKIIVTALSVYRFANVTNESLYLNVGNMIVNLQGCDELLPIFHKAVGPGEASPITVGSSEERTGLLKQIADLECKLSEAEKTFEAQGNRFQKSWDERAKHIDGKNVEIDTLKREVNTLSSLNKLLGEERDEILAGKKHTGQGTVGQQKHIEMLELQLSEKTKALANYKGIAGEMTYDAISKENDSLKKEVASLANCLDGSETCRQQLQDKLTYWTDVSASRLQELENLSHYIKRKEDLIKDRDSEFQTLRQMRDVAEREVQGSHASIKSLNFEIVKLKEMVDSFKTVNMTLNDTNMKRAIRIDALQKQVSDFCKTCDKIVDERDTARKAMDVLSKENIVLINQRDALRKSADIGDKVLNRVQTPYAKLEKFINETTFSYLEQFKKLRHLVNQPWSDEMEQDRVRSWGEIVEPVKDSVEPPKHWDCDKACGESSKVFDRETWVGSPIDANVGNDGQLVIKLLIDTSEAANSLERIARALRK